MVAETDMGKPLSKAWNGGDCDVLGETEEVTQSEAKSVSEKHVLIAIKVRPCESGTTRSQSHAFPTGLPMSIG
jgi:hypothetical protein